MIVAKRGSARRQVLEQDGCEVWVITRPLDRARFGPAAATVLTLLNAQPAPLFIGEITVQWLTGPPVRWSQPGWIESGAVLTLLDGQSFDILMGSTRRQGRRGFGIQEVPHTLTLCVYAPIVTELTLEVRWGFAMPNDEMGFFLPLLDV